MVESRTKRRFKEWCEVTSCHGVIDCFQSTSWLGKSFWAFLILGSFGIATWQVYELILDFCSEPHYQTTTYALSDVSVPFPNITICNMNRADRKKAMALGMTMEHNSSELDPDYLNHFYMSFQASYIGNLINDGDDDFALGDGAIVAKIKERKAKYDAWIIGQNLTHLNAVDLLHKLGLGCTDMVKQCWFYAGDLPNCCKGAKPVVTSNGLCWLLDTPVKTAKGKGIVRGVVYGNIHTVK